jgi:cysteine desulfurase
MKRIYADSNATTPVAPEVLDAMLPYLTEKFGNASSVHFFGRETRAAVDDCRVRLAKLLGAKEGEIVFTGGGTESNNAAIFGAPPGHIITSTIEHHAVLHAAQRRPAVTFLPVSPDGLVDPADLRQAIRKDTVLVSIMTANNETGTIQPIRELAGIAHKQGIPFHTDAVQAFGKIPVTVADVDLLSISAHKFNGPKGVGAMFIRRGTKCQPFLVGGSHENERRAGTENVAGIVGLVKAAELAIAKLPEESRRLRELTDRLALQITGRIIVARRNHHPTQRVPNTVNFSFEGCDSEGLILGLDLEGIAVSSGSACAAGSLEPSHVLKAMGLRHAQCRSALRFSLGTGNTAEDIPVIVDAVERVVERLRKFTGV